MYFVLIFVVFFVLCYQLLDFIRLYKSQKISEVVEHYMADDEKIENIGVCINHPNIFISIIFAFMVYFLLSLFLPTLMNVEQFNYLLKPLILSTSVVFLFFSYLIIKKRFSNIAILTNKNLFIADFNNIQNDYISCKVQLSNISECKYRSFMSIPHLFFRLNNGEEKEITHITNLKQINEYIENVIK